MEIFHTVAMCGDQTRAGHEIRARITLARVMHLSLTGVKQ